VMLSPAFPQVLTEAVMTKGLRVTDLRLNVSATGDDIVDEVRISIEPGKVLALVGESGSGKTTVGLAVLGHSRRGVTIAHGRVECADTEVLGLSEDAKRKIRGELVSYVPQDPASSLNPALRIGVQLMEALEVHDFGGSAESRKIRLKQMMAEVLLPTDEEYLLRYPHQLSGGQQQRVGLAMAFACRPSVIVLDEPTTGLDVSTQEHVLKTIRQLTRDHGVAALYITHDLAVVADLADDVAVMYAGRIVECGSVKDIFTNPAHPYTKHLVVAAPDIEGKKEIVGLAGRAPSPGKRPTGCSFALRCESADDACRSAFPAEVSVATGHVTRCIKIGKLPNVVVAKPRASQTIESGASVVVLQDVSAGYSGNMVVYNVSLTIRRGECLALVGESGSGKTTVSRAIGGLHREWTGSMSFNGEELQKTARRRTSGARQGIQYIFQNPYGSLNPRRTIGESISRPLAIIGTSKSESREAILDVLEKVNLPGSYAGKYPDQLSGGERQRVAIARALVSNPMVLVCDEVTSALDVLVQAAIIDLLGDLRKQLGLAMLFVTHNLPLVRSIADEVAVMSEGRIVEIGPAESVIGNPQQSYTKSLITATPSIERSMR
jgi:peptide/nickel transport system ATP-binding protein